MKNLFLVMLSLLLAGGLAACVTEQVEDPDSGESYLNREIDKVVKRLPYQTGPDLYRDLNKLIAFGSFAVEPMREALDHPNAKVRSSGAYVLGQLQAEDAVDDLMDLTKDENKLVRLEAARAVLEIGAWETVPILLDGLKDQDQSVRFLCIQALKQKTGEDFGYKFSTPAEEQREALHKWQNWWNATKGNENMEGSMGTG